jgi:voltage-gated potassium channel
MQAVTESNNFTYLIISLVGLLLSSALIDTVPGFATHLFLQGIVFLTFAVGYRSLNFGLRWRRFVTVLLLLLIVSNLAHEFTNWGYSGILGLLVMVIYFMGAAYRSAQQVLFSGRIDQNIIVGSIAIFLLLGLIWATLYLVVLEFSATAFNGMPAGDWVENFSTACYFSYVTLTTLGYGDISPAEPVSRVLVYFEAITGAFYMAIVVASLVGARRSDQ